MSAIRVGYSRRMIRPDMGSLFALAALLAGCGAELERSQRALMSVQNDELRIELDYDGAHLTTIRYIRNERVADRLNVEYRDGKISTVFWFNREEDELPSSSTTYAYDDDRLLAMSARLMNSGSINFFDWGYDLTYVYEGD